MRRPALALCIAGSVCGASSAGDAPPARGEREPSANERLLASRRVVLPVPRQGFAPIRDTFFDGRAGHPHEAIDIGAPRGTKVFAVDDGTVAKLFTSAAGGLTVYQFDPRRQLAYYYAHLDRYADGLREGASVRRCDLLGYVGTSGNAPASAPHLHFAVFRLGSPPQWWRGEPINPYQALRASLESASTGGERSEGACPSRTAPSTP